MASGDQIRLLNAVFHHVCFPRKLPNSEGFDNEQIAVELHQRILHAARELRTKAPAQCFDKLNVLCKTLATCAGLYNEGCLEKAALLKAFQNLERNDFLFLFVRQQNAGLVVIKDVSEVTFQAFEASAQSAEVLASQKALQWDFPGSAVSIPNDTFEDDGFIRSLASFLDRASREPVHQLLATTFKNGQNIGESRDTGNPALICSLLMTLLEVNGTYKPVNKIRKRIRDDVCFESKGLPWRRLPYWLVLRVSVQLHLQNGLGNEVGQVTYKFLMAEVVRRLCVDLDTNVSSTMEQLAGAREKLACRLAKLTAVHVSSVPEAKQIYEQFLVNLQGPCRLAIARINRKIDNAWTAFRDRFYKHIPRLRQLATNDEITMTLPNSRGYLDVAWAAQSAVDPHIQAQTEASTVTKSLYSTEIHHHMDWAAKEQQLHGFALGPVPSSCHAYSVSISQYMRQISHAYDTFVPGTSIMLLTVMELWTAMDAMTLREYPLLADHQVPFPPTLLEVLQLSSLKDMKRAEQVETYLAKRQSDARLPPIFADPSHDSFAVRMFDNNDTQHLNEMLASILAKAKNDAAAKIRELKQSFNVYSSLVAQHNSGTCLTESDPVHRGLLRHVGRGQCPRCRLWGKMKSMQIEIFEYPLPDDKAQQKAICFELRCPESFAVYREATWRLMQSLTVAGVPSYGACFKIDGYPPLTRYANGRDNNPSLASKSKPMIASHYKKMSLTISEDDVCVPCTLDVAYYDISSKVLTAKQSTLASVASMCTEPIPLESPFSSLQMSSDYTIDGCGPTPNQLLANQTRCPASANVTEFAAFQDMYSGEQLLWLKLLRELGCSNVNFSSAATFVIVSRVCLQNGPRKVGTSLRKRHWVFNDPNFCQILLNLIHGRVQNVASNWREHRCVSNMLLMLLRLLSLASDNDILERGMIVLEEIRSITLHWIRALHVEVSSLENAATWEQRRRDMVWACLLCRWTLSWVAEDASRSLEPRLACLWVEVSIVLCQNQDKPFNSLSPQLRNAFIRDWRLLADMRERIQVALSRNGTAISKGVMLAWQQKDDAGAPNFGPWVLGDNGWLSSAIVSTSTSQPLEVRYNFISGILLVGGQAMSEVPEEHRTLGVMQDLLGNQRFLTRRSERADMHYTITVPINAHEVHVGTRNQQQVIHLVHQPSQTLYEVIPPNVFGSRMTSDLPWHMVQNYVHWLNVKMGWVEIRPKPNFWEATDSTWYLDLNTSLMSSKQYYMIDPHSGLFRIMGNIFQDFELRENIQVRQPITRADPLAVELTKMDLRFEVNHHDALYSRELLAEIDRNQDAGTWYGLKSKLVLRNPTTLKLRSVIVPVGVPTIVPDGIHVSVTIAGAGGSYGRFFINEPVHRLDCAAEPVLIYLRAQLHALTSFILPDSLTGRTGTEQAIWLLQSANARPWQPLNIKPRTILSQISSLSPFREYCHPRQKTMQRILWKEGLPVTIQNEEFQVLVGDIELRSKMLESFHHTSVGQEQRPAWNRSDVWLRQRAIIRSCPHQRQRRYASSEQNTGDHPYLARHDIDSSERSVYVSEASQAIKQWASRVPLPQNLGQMIESWGQTIGFVGCYDDETIARPLKGNFNEDWSLLANRCRSASETDKYELMFLFALLSYGQNTDMYCVRSLIPFATLGELKALDPPQWETYEKFMFGERPSVTWLKHELQPCKFAFEHEDALYNDARLTPRQVTTLQAERKLHEAETATQLTRLVNFLLALQWPDPVLTEAMPINLPLISFSKAIEIIQLEWQRLAKNFHLSEYLMRVQKVFNDHSQLLSDQVHRQYHTSSIFQQARGSLVFPDLPTFLHSFVFDFDEMENQYSVTEHFLNSMRNEYRHSFDRQSFGNAFSWQPPTQELGNTIEQVLKTGNSTRRKYAVDLERSLQAFRNAPGSRVILPWDFDVKRVDEAIRTALAITRRNLEFLQKYFETQSGNEWLSASHLLPRVTPTTILGLLTADKVRLLGRNMRRSLVSIGVHITRTQQLIRLEHALRQRKHHIVQAEIQNPGHLSWNPDDNSEWLVLEIESDIMIRPTQVEVARATIEPRSGSNSVLQMNMGEGKTSCIIPMVAATLADSTCLVRVIVPKALLPQMAQVLQSRLGGLLSRPVVNIPFSRRTPTAVDSVQKFQHLHNAILENCGVILTVPESVMSFKLSGLQRLTDEKFGEAKAMIQTQHMLDQTCRDILDESDFTLAVRTQLIYPSGAQKAVDGHPRRWLTPESLLQLVSGLLWNISRKFERAIEVDYRSSAGFPTVYFLRKEAEDELVANLVNSLCDGQGGVLNLLHCPQDIKEHARKFISQSSVSNRRVTRLMQFYTKQDRVIEWKDLLLLRGLLVHRILIMALKKRWNVQYGLHPQRDPISVPFHAKGRPSDTAEWGHPDVAILLTCLSFYYAGISLVQFRQGLESVLKSDDRAAEYDRWLLGSPRTSGSLRDCNALNIDDAVQLEELWRSFRYNTTVIDYYLNRFVFPRHAKQFEQKLQASSWDIPLTRNPRPVGNAPGSKTLRLESSDSKRADSRKPILTTGFSGTNDNRTMLPLTIAQNDLPELLGTNAEVLSYLLEPRNRKYIQAANHSTGRRLSELELLDLLKNHKIRVFIDAGAQILESDNLSLVRAWLQKDQDRPAAVYFDDNDKPMICHRKGQIVPLLSSSYADDLANCLVYLDEAHTRGTDLKLPTNAVGALTLGPGQTKDHTVQAAMRMRQLGTTQSVRFFAPPEVHHSILDFRHKGLDYQPDSGDVVAWLIEQTCRGLDQLQPLFYSQGVNFCDRSQAELDFSNHAADKAQRSDFLRAVIQQEDHSLEQLYKPKLKQRQTATAIEYGSADLTRYKKELREVRNSFDDAGDAVQATALQEVEQEREVAVEAETVRAIEKPPHREPLAHRHIDAGLKQFCVDGRVRSKIHLGYSLPEFWRTTSVGRDHGVIDLSQRPRIYITQDFANTVKPDFRKPDDNYVRPVNWIIWSMVDNVAVVISPHEAEGLLATLRSCQDPKTHLIVYAAPITRNMLHFDDFNFYSIPPLPTDWRAPQWLRRDIGILAGKLYFRFEDYAEICRFLGVRPKIKGAPSNVDGTLEEDTWKGQLSPRPLQFLQQWITTRRKGQDFAHTPMGFVVQSKELDPTHPFFAEEQPEIDDTAENAKVSEDGVSNPDSMDQAVGGTNEGEGEGENEDGGMGDDDEVRLGIAVDFGVDDKEDHPVDDGPTSTGQDEASSESEQATGGADEDQEEKWSVGDDAEDKDEIDGPINLIAGGMGTAMFDSANDLFEDE
ncbi:MAG: hypothetical protein Q9159_005747 [Coniocarpon cinnabarinum]